MDRVVKRLFADSVGVDAVGVEAFQSGELDGRQYLFVRKVPLTMGEDRRCAVFLVLVV
jgi:hypothetical protein